MLDKLAGRSFSELLNLGSLEAGATATLEERVQAERDVFETMKAVKAKRGRPLAISSLIGAVLLGGSAVAFTYYANAPEGNGAGYFLAGLAGGIFALIDGTAFISIRLIEYLRAAAQMNKAKHLSDSGYVFASDLSSHPLLPSQVGEINSVKIEAAESGGYLRPTEVIAVREQPLEVRCVNLADLPQYAAKPVIVSANVTSAPANEDMKLHGTVGLRLRSMFVSGTARGYVDGDVYVEDTPFRIGDNQGTSFAAEMSYLRTFQESHMLPIELRRYSGGFSAVGNSHRNGLVHLLDEAGNAKEKLLFMGKLDEAGVFHVELVARQSREMYFLAVRQPLAQLEVG